MVNYRIYSGTFGGLVQQVTRSDMRQLSNLKNAKKRLRDTVELTERLAFTENGLRILSTTVSSYLLISNAELHRHALSSFG